MTRTKWTLLVGAFLLVAPLRFAAARAETGVTGKWITDSFLPAAQQREAEEQARRNAAPAVDPFAGQGMRGPRGALRGGPRARGGNNYLPAVSVLPQERQEKRAAAEEQPEDGPVVPAIMMDLKAAKAKLTGNVVIISLQDFVEEKAKVEKGAIKEKSFEFTTYKKVGNVEIPTSWRGELVSDDTIKLKRLTQAGKPADEVGELTLTRAR